MYTQCKNQSLYPGCYSFSSITTAIPITKIINMKNEVLYLIKFLGNT